MFYWDWGGAERDLARATELDPSSAMAHFWYSFFLMSMTRHDEAIAEIQRALELDPLSPLVNTALWLTLFYAHQYGESITQLEKTLEVDANYMPAHLFLGYSYALKGMYAEAISECHKGRDLSPTDPLTLTMLGYVYALSGNRSEASKVLEQLKAQSRRVYVNPVYVAWIYAALRENGGAFEWLNKGYQERSSQMCAVKTEIALDNLRTDPRYQELLRRMRFPD